MAVPTPVLRVFDAVMSMALPTALNIFFVMMVGGQTDQPRWTLDAAMIAAAVGGLFAGWRHPVASLALAVSLPVLMAWDGTYGKLDVFSPAGAAPSLVHAVAGFELGPIPAYALIIAACLLPGWLLVTVFTRFQLIKRGSWNTLTSQMMPLDWATLLIGIGVGLTISFWSLMEQRRLWSLPLMTSMGEVISCQDRWDGDSGQYYINAFRFVDRSGRSWTGSTGSLNYCLMPGKQLLVEWPQGRPDIARVREVR